MLVFDLNLNLIVSIPVYPGNVNTYPGDLPGFMKGVLLCSL